MCVFAYDYENKFLKVCLIVSVQIPHSKFHNQIFCIIMALTYHQLPKEK